MNPLFVRFLCIDVFQEYEEGTTAEAKFVKGLFSLVVQKARIDRQIFIQTWIDSKWRLKVQYATIFILNLVLMQMYLALEYEQNHGATTLQPFFDSSIPKLRHPEVKQWGEDLLGERQRLKQNREEPTT
jgi:hypothetical protein